MRGIQPAARRRGSRQVSGFPLQLSERTHSIAHGSPSAFPFNMLGRTVEVVEGDLEATLKNHRDQQERLLETRESTWNRYKDDVANAPAP